MRQETSYTDQAGRKWAVWLPAGVPITDAKMGIPIGPPSLEPLNLPLLVEVRLHNQLFARRLFTLKDVQRRRQDVVAAVMATFKVDAESIIQLYVGDETIKIENVLLQKIKPNSVSSRPGQRIASRGKGGN